MPDGSDRRNFLRSPIRLPLLHAPGFPTRTRMGGGWTHSVSEGGACLELDRPLPPRTRLHIFFQTDRGTIAAETEVIWVAESTVAGEDSTERSVLHGVAFTHLAPDQRQALRDLILSQRRERRTAVRLPVELTVTGQTRGAPAQPLRGRTGNMSRGGLSLRLPHALAAGTTLELTLHLPDGPLTTNGEIIWVDPEYRQTYGDPVRHGVRFAAPGWPPAPVLCRILVGLL